MPNGVRHSIWALFFLAGMAFMAALIFMARPELFSRDVVKERPGSSIIVGDAMQEEIEAANVAPSVEVPVVLPVVDRSERTETNAEKRVAAVEKTPEVAPAPAVEVRPILPPQKTALAAKQTTELVRRVRPGRSVFGHVTLLGDLPPLKELPLSDGFCGAHSVATTIVSRVFLRAQDNSLADVVVSLEARSLEKRHWMAPAQTATVVQRDCQFEPYITAIQLGQSVTVENLDPVLHNVNSRPMNSKNRPFNLAQTPKARPIVAEFREPEMFVRVECNVHPYMVAYVCVMPHPFFAMTKEDGRFLIPNVPPGEYIVRATHRRAGSVTRKVTVTEEESPEVEFVLEAPTEIANADSLKR